MSYILDLDIQVLHRLPVSSILRTSLVSSHWNKITNKALEVLFYKTYGFLLRPDVNYMLLLVVPYSWLQLATYVAKYGPLHVFPTVVGKLNFDEIYYLTQVIIERKKTAAFKVLLGLGVLGEHLPLKRAIETESDKIVEELLRVASPAVLTDGLTMAIRKGNIDPISTILGMGVDINDSLVIDSLVYAKSAIVHMILDQNPSINTLERILSFRAGTGSEEIVERLVSMGADVNCFSGAPLIRAVKESKHQIVTLLLKLGADIHIQNDLALITALERDNLDMVALLIDEGALGDRTGQHLINLVNSKYRSRSMDYFRYQMDPVRAYNQRCIARMPNGERCRKLAKKGNCCPKHR